MSSDDDGVSVDPNVSLEAVASDSDGTDGVSDGASSVDDASVDDVSVEGVSDSGFDSASGFDSELELLNIEPIGSKPNIPEDDEED